MELLLSHVDVAQDLGKAHDLEDPPQVLTQGLPKEVVVCHAFGQEVAQFVALSLWKCACQQRESCVRAAGVVLKCVIAIIDHLRSKFYTLLLTLILCRRIIRFTP